MRSNGEINRVRSRPVPGRKGPGRPKKTWEECVKQDLKVCGLSEAGTQDRLSWRSSVKNSRQEPTPSNGSLLQSLAAPPARRVLGMRTHSFNKTGFDWLIDTFKYDRRDSIAAEPPVKFPSNQSIWNINITLFCYWLKMKSTMSHYEIVVSLSLLTTSVYTDHPMILYEWSVGARSTHDFRLWTAMPGPLLLRRADTSKSIASRKPLSQMRWDPCNNSPPTCLAIQTHHTKIGHTTTSQHWYGTSPGPEHISFQWVSVRKM